MRKYVTIQGDMWDNIAKKVYGDEAKMNVLLEHNVEYQDIVIFPANVTLVCPTIPTKRTTILPPWKR